MPRRHRRDEGTTHVLEAVIIACIMLSAVAFVATFENPVTGSSPTRDLLEKKSTDALALLVDTPVRNSTYGDNLMSVLLAQCLQGACGNLTAKLDKLLPVGASYAIYVSNGYDIFPVYVTKQPSGEAVTSKVLLEPHWSYTFTSTGLSVINNATDPKVTYALPVYNSNVISPGGSPLKVIVKGIKQSDGSQYTLEAFYTTEAVDSVNAGQVPAVSMNFLVNKTGKSNGWDTIGAYVPGAFWYRIGETMTTSGHPSNQSLEFRIQINESANVPVPAGTEITVNIPRGWNATGTNDANWMVVQHATDRNGSHNGSDIVARLLRPIQGESVEFRFNATYHGDLLRYYPFRAMLSRGAYAEANVIVEADDWPEYTQTFAIPRVVASVPRPMGATVDTTWSLAVNIPYHPVGGFVVSKQSLMRPPVTSGGTAPPQSISTSGRSLIPSVSVSASAARQATNIIITNVTILEQNGANIFDTITPGRIGFGHGTWTSYGDRLEWRGMHSTTSQLTLNLTFNVTGKGTAGSTMPKSAITPPVDYSKFTGRLLHQTAPGFYRDSVLPNNTTATLYEAYGSYYRGYDPSVLNGTTGLLHTYTSSPVHRASTLKGTGNYTSHPISPFTDALYGSYVAVAKRNVPIGGQVVLTADVQSILYALSAAGQSAGVNLTFYPPWAGDSKIPIWSQNNLDSAILASNVVQLVMLDMNADGFPDPVVGTDQGRVIGFNAVNAERLQGNTWIAPVLSGQSGVAVIKHLSLITLGGQDYIVVGTDGKSGVYVLDKQFNAVWSWSKTADTATLATAAIDTSADIDLDGRRDIVVALENGAVYVLRALAGNPELQPLAPAAPPPSPFAAFNKSQGTPSAIQGLQSIGQSGTAGIAVSLVSMPGADLNLRLDKDHPEQTSANPQLTVKTPRAGVTAFDNVGGTAWTFLNAPVSTMRPFDANGDARTDLLLGATSGYVVLLNGERGTNPTSGAIWTPVQALVDGDARDLAHSVWLTDDGVIAFSYDGWLTHNCVSCDPVINGLGASYPTMNGIALNSTMGIWAAGDNSIMLRSTKGLAPGYPWMATVVPNATKAGVGYNFNLSLHRFNDIHFDWGPQGDNGWAVGSPLAPGLCMEPIVPAALLAHCDEGLVMRTTNGGQSWTILSALDGSMNGTAGAVAEVTANLTRVNFTTDSVGWIVGERGTLLRSLDGGVTFRQLALDTTAHLRDISCDSRDPSKCIVVGDAGVVLRSRDATSPGPQWENLSLRLPDPGRDLVSVGLVSANEAYIGLENKLLYTLDGGDRWTELPMGYVQSTPMRMSVFPDGSGYIYGGNETSGRQWWLHSHARAATARTTDITASLPLPTTAKVHEASAWVAATAGTGASFKVLLSGNGGAAWNATKETMDGKTSSEMNTVPVALSRDKWTVNFTSGYPVAECAACGRDVRLRIDLETTPDISMQSVFVGDLEVEVRYFDSASGTHENRTYVVDLATGALKDPTSTAVWNKESRTIHIPLVDGSFWSTNVSGGVHDLQTGWNVVGGPEKDIWVATGDVVAENSPDYAIYAGSNVSRVMSADNRVYLLDGKNGTIMARTESLPGNVLQIRPVDLTGDGVPDRIYASIAKNATIAAQIRAFDARTLAPIDDPLGDPAGWRYSMNPNSILVHDMEVGMNSSREPSLFLGRTGYVSGANVVGGGVAQISATDASSQWTARADVRGVYEISKDIPRNWFFGPYVVEVKVDWQETVEVTEGGVLTNKTIVQSAQFYDYFMVTPPDALNPPNPIYTVHLVSWLNDWR